MPRVAKELTDAAIRSLAKKKGMHRVGGCPGLTLKVVSETSGTAAWVLRVWLKSGKRRDIRLGYYDAVSLKEAREKGRAARQLIWDGGDPAEERREKIKAARVKRVELTFKVAVDRYLEAKVKHFKNDKHKAQWRSTLDTYTKSIAEMNVAEIDQDHIKAILLQQTDVRGGKPGKLWEVKNETASRLRGRIEAVLAWCTFHRHRSGDNPAKWTGFFATALPKPSDVKTVKNFAALPYADMEDFMKKLRGQTGYGPLALEWTILTAARSGETRGMTWDEIDFTEKVWKVPASRMKMKVEHRVPLSEAALAVLARTDRVLGIDLVFPGSKGPLSDMTLTKCVRRLGYDVTVHGFRSTFRDWAAEKTEHPRHFAELALAHNVKGDSEASYFRSDIMEKRRVLMQDWADHCLPEG